MRHLELHILQSVPVSCLNRDDFGSPKMAVFGGVSRARVSSQCWKSAARKLMHEEAPALFGGQRTRLIIEPLCGIFQEQHHYNEEDARKAAEEVGSEISKLDTPPDRIKTLFFTSKQELENLASAYVDFCNARQAAKDAGKPSKKAFGDTVRRLEKRTFEDAADIALFGRMMASVPTLNVEAAAMFSHALSTHKVSNEIDFFTAVDDLQPEDVAGAGMTGTLEYNSATYYRFVALNMDLLAEHLSALSLAERQDAVRHFVAATLKAVPGARKNSMNASTLPAYVLVVVREEGHPVQLVNAFEKPVWSRDGMLAKSIECVEQEYARLKEIWGLPAVLECRMPESSLSSMLEEVVQHVR